MKRLICALVLASCTLLIPPSLTFAQDDESLALDRVEVTGTRIKKAAIEGTSPVTTIDREEIERSGLTSVADLLQDLATSGSTLNTQFNSSGNFGFPPDGSGVGAGSARVNLRHLGEERTLVLVDGKRWVNGSAASGVPSAVDLNTIPLSMVDRIEILEDGASALYGSDAIAGVVNIITRKDFDGLEANAYYGEYFEGDGATSRFDVSLGKSGTDFNIVLGASYTDQERVSAADREQARFPTPNTGVTRGSSGTPQGRFIFSIPGMTDPSGGLCSPVDSDMDGTPDSYSCNLTTPTGSSFAGGVPSFPGDFIPFTNDERFNFSPFNLVVTPSERTSVFGQGALDLTDNISFYMKAMYTNRESTNQAAPEPIFLGPGAGTGGLADSISISADNPFNPFGIDLDASDNFILLGRRPLEAGPRIFQQDVDTSFIGAGLEGGFDAGTRYFLWDVNFGYSKNQADQTKNGALNIRRIGVALGDPDVCAAEAGCVPLNLFGGAGTITPEMLDYIGFVQKDSSENELTYFSANITGDAFDGWAGPIAFAAGVETRELEGSFQPDPIVVAGESNGIPAQPTSGEYDVDEAYLEVNIPLVSGARGAELIDLTAAGRYSDYSTFGSETTTKFTLRWQPNDEFTARATFAEGFRAPGIGELFGSAARFDATLDDPCSTPTDFGSNCAQLGVPAGFVQANPQISVTTGGNPDLEPETADSFTAGFVWSPEFVTEAGWIDVFDVEFTYYDHEVDGFIQAIDAQTQLNQCVATLSPQFCNGINRNSSGAIAGFANRLTNIGSLETDGFDLNFNYFGPDTDIGRFGVIWRNTFVNDFTETSLTGETSLEGVERNDSGIPEWKSNLSLIWQAGPWEASWSLRYIDELTESCSDFLDGTPNGLAELGLCSDPVNRLNELDATLYNDVQVSYTFPWNDNGVTLTGGVRNLFDEDPPLCYSCSLNGYDASNYDIPESQFGYIQLGVRF